jgi:hypothetical protein
MGTPCAVVLANVFTFMICERLRDHNLIVLFRRFIDDIFMIARFTPETPAILFSVLNDLHPGITFPSSDFHHSRTTINMLDLTIYRPSPSSTTLSFRLYTKPCNRFLYIPFSSFHTKSTLKGFIKGELLRFASHSSSFSNYNDSANLFFTHLLDRDYPPSFLLPIFKLVSWPPAAPRREPSSSSSVVPLLFHATHSPLLTHSLIHTTIRKHWTYIERDYSGSFLFPEPPIICWKNPPSFEKMMNKLQTRI